MLTGKMLHGAFIETLQVGSGWREISEESRQTYNTMAFHANVEAGICPQCGSIPARGLLEVVGERFCAVDCPGQDSGKWCDHRCVGALIRNSGGDVLMFKRGTYPFAMAGPAGHLDGDEPDVAVGKEVGEEVGLHVVSARPLAQFWHYSRCRRRFAGTAGHHWTFFEVVADGELLASMRETLPESLAWYSSEDVARFVKQTDQYLNTRDGSIEHLDLPWYDLFRALGCDV